MLVEISITMTDEEYAIINGKMNLTEVPLQGVFGIAGMSKNHLTLFNRDGIVIDGLAFDRCV